VLPSAFRSQGFDQGRSIEKDLKKYNLMFIFLDKRFNKWHFAKEENVGFTAIFLNQILEWV